MVDLAAECVVVHRGPEADGYRSRSEQADGLLVAAGVEVDLTELFA